MESTPGINIIAHIFNDYQEKFGIPRQSGLVPELQSVIIFDEPFRINESLRGIESYSHLWLLWQFSENVQNGWSPTVRPPRLGGNKRIGVFATRSPFRPSSIGLSSVKLESVEITEKYGTILRVSGADLMNNTPIYDIKPYVKYTDSHPDAVCSFADDFSDYSLKVLFPPELLSKVDKDKQVSLIRILENDPRPAYQNDPDRIYRMLFGKYTVSFKVSSDELTVVDITQ